MNKKTLVLGASDNPERYSYLAINRLRSHGHEVVAIGKKETSVADVFIETEKKHFQNIDTVTLYLRPEHQKEYYNYILSLKPRRIIFNPGTENDELYDLAKTNNIQPMEACTLVMLNTGQY
ncbi:MAG TPA: CoA-binding protein [Chitinophagaceae bacterium]|nr:CoA-binding protein [Chitinophagaceae bacterium]